MSAEQRARALGLDLPEPPRPLGAYVPSIRSGRLLFLSGMLPTRNQRLVVAGRLGRELDIEGARTAARAAALNVLATTRAALGSLDHVTRVVRIVVSIATDGDSRDHPHVADAASELLRDVFGEDKMSVRSLYGVASLPLDAPVELEVTLEVDEATP